MENLSSNGGVFNEVLESLNSKYGIDHLKFEQGEVFKTYSSKDYDVDLYDPTHLAIYDHRNNITVNLYDFDGGIEGWDLVKLDNTDSFGHKYTSAFQSSLTEAGRVELVRLYRESPTPYTNIVENITFTNFLNDCDIRNSNPKGYESGKYRFDFTRHFDGFASKDNKFDLGEDFSFDYKSLDPQKMFSTYYDYLNNIDNPPYPSQNI